MFGPLIFQETRCNVKTSTETSCVLCQDSFNLELCLPVFLKHIFDVHHLVIEDVQNIDNLQEYIKYWKHKLLEKSIEQIIPAIKISSTEDKYFLLSTLLQEDKELRHKLRLVNMLKVQEYERNDTTFTKPCLFCKFNFQGKRCDYLSHLSNEHNIRLGNPQNLVHIDELVNKIEEKLESLQCLYCEKTFCDRTALKEHMRKKQHKRINPSNQAYDKYYSVNYLDPDRKWYNINKDIDISQHCGNQENSDEEYSDWNEGDTFIICLFCSEKRTDISKLCFHMNSKHQFNFHSISQNLDFYQKIKLVNYIRRQVHNLQCIYCNNSFEDIMSLNEHMSVDKHYHIPELKIYDQPEFYFPTYENDSFLYFLEEIDD